MTLQDVWKYITSQFYIGLLCTNLHQSLVKFLDFAVIEILPGQYVVKLPRSANSLTTPVSQARLGHRQVFKRLPSTLSDEYATLQSRPKLRRYFIDCTRNEIKLQWKILSNSEQLRQQAQSHNNVYRLHVHS